MIIDNEIGKIVVMMSMLFIKLMYESKVMFHESKNFAIIVILNIISFSSVFLRET